MTYKEIERQLAFYKNRTAKMTVFLLDAMQSHDCAGIGECWCDELWEFMGLPGWGRVDAARVALRRLRDAA